MMMAVAFLRFPITLLYCSAGLVIGTLFLTTPSLLQQVPEGEPDWMMPVFIIEYLPSGVVGILVVAILAAAMSSLSSAINSLAAVTVEDIGRWRQCRPDNVRYLKQARLAGIGWGIVTLVLSLYAGDIAPTVIEAINKIGSVFYGPVLAIFLLGIHFTSVSPRAANTGLALGVAVNVGLWLFDSSLFWFWWNAIGFAVTVSVGLVLSVIWPNDVTHTLTSVRGMNLRRAGVLLCWSVLLILFCTWIPEWLQAFR